MYTPLIIKRIHRSFTPTKIANQLVRIAEHMADTGKVFYSVQDKFFEKLSSDGLKEFALVDYRDIADGYIANMPQEEQILFVLLVSRFLRTDGFVTL